VALIKVQKRAKLGVVFLLDERDFLKAQDVWVRDEDVQAVPAPPPPTPVLSTVHAPVDEEETPVVVTDEPREAAVDPAFYRRPPRRKTRVLPEE
jgi:hypothetical protein